MKKQRDRLDDLRDYAVGLAFRAEYTGEGCAQDLRDIVKALDDLIAHKAINPKQRAA